MSLQEVDLRAFETVGGGRDASEPALAWPRRVRVFKRVVDIYFSIIALPVMAVLAVVLLILNPFFNPGPVFFRQERMGQGYAPFRIWKFRTMAPCTGSRRRHDDPLEEHRINRLGAILRKSRLDELPNFINVLRGEMSLIGPRPDMVEHARSYSVTIPRYHERFRVKPGITGLAQVRYGYADHERAVRRKSRNDSIYVDRYSILMDFYIIRRTISVMLSGFGAR